MFFRHSSQSDVLAWYLTGAFAAMKIIYRFNARTFYVEELVTVSGALRLFGSCVRPACDVLIWKKYVRRWSKRGQLLYVFRSEPFDYVMWFLTCLTVSIFAGVITMVSMNSAEVMFFTIITVWQSIDAAFIVYILKS